MREYGCLMVGYQTPKIITDIQDKIDKKDIYYGETPEEKNDYGLEKESHVTIAYGFDPDVTSDQLKEFLPDLDDCKGVLVRISLFINENFDVLKCDVKSNVLNKTNEKIQNKFELHTKYKDYHPHMTIGYLKKGTGEKYTNDINYKIVELKPKEFIFSSINKKGENYQESFK